MELKIFKNLNNMQKKIDDEINNKYKNNPSFCMAPWIHLFISPNGDVTLCCNSLNSSDTILGNINDNSLEEIWNSEVIKKIRLKMLSGEKINGCSSCYEIEEIDNSLSMRNKLFNNRYYNKYKDIVESTDSNGEVKKVNIVYFDFRLNNKCNFTCKTCGPHFSSSWEKKLNVETKKIKDIEKIRQKTKELILNDCLDEIYFAGGEPLINDLHWEIIDFLIEQKKFDILIRYNTNLSTLVYKGNNFIDKLKLFKNVRVSPSCDSLGTKGEYIRTGFSSKNFIKNIKLLKENNFNYLLTTVISFFNLIYMYDFFNQLYQNNIYMDEINFIVLDKNDRFSIFNIPNDMLVKTLHEFDRIINSDFISEKNKDFFKKLSISLKENHHFDLKKFNNITIKSIKNQDEINNLKMIDYLPELYKLISNKIINFNIFKHDFKI